MKTLYELSVGLDPASPCSGAVAGECVPDESRWLPGETRTYFEAQAASAFGDPTVLGEESAQPGLAPAAGGGPSTSLGASGGGGGGCYAAADVGTAGGTAFLLLAVVFVLRSLSRARLFVSHSADNE